MKLFGNKRHAEHMRRRGLSGVQRGLVLLIVSFVVLACSGYAFIHVWRDFAKPPEIPVSAEGTGPTKIVEEEQYDEETGETVIVEVEVPASRVPGVYNILVVGTDDDGVRTDTIIIAHIDVNTHSVALLSVPRDTVITGNYTVPKINGVYGGAGGGERGMERLKQKLNELLGFGVDGYAVVDLNAFVQLVDLVGGVDYDVPMDMDYDDPTQDLYIHLKKGPQHLNGNQAMQLVRFRKGYNRQDIDRTVTQQNFLKELAKKCIAELSITDIGGVATIFKENVTTDLTLGNVAYFGEQLLQCDFENMFTYTLQGEAVMLNDASCWAIYREDTLRVVNEYFNPYDVDISAANVSIITPADARAMQAARDAEKEDEEQTEDDEEQLDDEEDLPLTEDPFEQVEIPEVDPEEYPEETPEENPEESLEEIPNEGQQELPTDDWVEVAPPEEPVDDAETDIEP